MGPQGSDVHARELLLQATLFTKQTGFGLLLVFGVCVEARSKTKKTKKQKNKPVLDYFWFLGVCVEASPRPPKTKTSVNPLWFFVFLFFWFLVACGVFLTSPWFWFVFLLGWVVF